MAILPQRSPTLRPHARISHKITLPTRIQCSATTPTKPRRPDPLTLNPTVTSRPPALNDPTLKSTLSHRAWLTTGCTTVLISLSKSVAISADSHIWLEPILAAFLGYILSDLGSGLYHWGIDNYGGAKTPILGPQIEAFQGHHKYPWTITRRQFANNLHALGRVMTFAVLPVDILCDDPVMLSFAGAFAGCVMFSQQFHAWAHTTRSRLPAAVAALQDGGVLVSTAQHGAHHRAPYNGNYCIVSGVWNGVLDGSRFFEAVEMVIFFRFGVRPRSWSEPNLDWTEESTDTTSLVS